MTFPRYPDYKDSGVEWLGEVPTHWDIFMGRRVFTNRRELASESDEQLAASQKYGVIPQSLMMELNDSKVMLALKGTESFRHVEKNDFVISLRSFEGGIEHSNYKGCVSPAYTVLNAIKNIEPNFFRHLFKSKAYVSALQATTDSLRDGKSITFQQFGDIQLVLPPASEQRAIAAFLDRETAKIDALIAEQQRLIELLKEKRQAVISHAVTKGLNPEAPMKNSGIEWLGEVPMHWKIGKCGFYLTILSGFAFPSSGFSSNETDVKLLRGINVGVSRLRWDDTVYWRRSENDGLDVYEMTANDLVIGMDRPLITEGMRVAKVTESDLPCLLLQRVASLKTGEQLNTDYLFSLLSSDMFIAHFHPDTTGVSVPHISPEQIQNFVIPVPPMSEQSAIVSFIQSETSKLDSLTAEAQRGIELLKERRTALISAAVTGKIDVRGLA
jgi:type I restriction enzyme S subunit